MRKSTKKEAFLHKPEYPGGMKALQQFISDNLRYPKLALEKKIEGTVRVQFDLDRDGVVLSAKVIAGCGHGCNEEAVRLIKMLRYFVDKNRMGGKIIFHQTLNIHFRLPVNNTVQVEVSAAEELEPDTQEQNLQQGAIQYQYQVVAKVTSQATKADAKKVDDKKDKPKPGVITFNIQM